MDISKIYEFVNNVIRLITKPFPLKNIIVLESKPDFADNTYAVYEELIRRKYNEKYKFYWFLNGPEQDLVLPENVFQQERFNTSFLNKVKAKLICARASFIIDSNTFIIKVHEKQKRIHLKHGLPMKDLYEYNHSVGSTDFISVPSEYWVKVCSNEHGIDEEKIKPFGFARNDVLLPKQHKNKTVIWMPTWRNHGNGTFIGINFEEIMPLGLPFIKDKAMLNEVNELFKENDAYLLVRLHPAQDLSKTSLAEMTNIKICNDKFLRENNISLYSLLCYTDALVSDYSSIYYDYLNLSKPIALAISDFNEYKKNNGILAKDKNEFKATYQAEHLEEYDDLIRFFKGVFNDDHDVYKCAEAQKKYMGFNDGNAAKRIVDYMEKEFDL